MCIHACVWCVSGKGGHLRDPSQTQTKELIYVLLHVAEVCDEASVNGLCVCWCYGDDATWSFSSGQLADRKEGNERE